MNISDRIEFLRERRGISLTHLNNEIGAYRGKLTEVRKGKASLNESEISILAQVLSTSTDYLLGNTDDPTPAGQKEEPPAQGGELSDDESKLILLFRQVPAEQQSAMIQAIEMTLRSQGLL